MELVVDPLSFICFCIRLIVESANTVHLILFPLSIIETSVLIVKLAFSMTHTIEFVSLIPTSHLEKLLHKLYLISFLSLRGFLSFFSLRFDFFLERKPLILENLRALSVWLSWMKLECGTLETTLSNSYGNRFLVLTRAGTFAEDWPQTYLWRSCASDILTHLRINIRGNRLDRRSLDCLYHGRRRGRNNSASKGGGNKIKSDLPLFWRVYSGSFTFLAWLRRREGYD